jgi:hypothetical protein
MSIRLLWVGGKLSLAGCDPDCDKPDRMGQAAGKIASRRSKSAAEAFLWASRLCHSEGRRKNGL